MYYSSNPSHAPLQRRTVPRPEHPTEYLHTWRERLFSYSASTTARRNTCMHVENVSSASPHRQQHAIGFRMREQGTLTLSGI